jgi:ABC-type transport system involved in multi-copper enzyme maturation permease subunit
MRRALGPTQVTWLLSAGLAAGALVLTTRTGAGPIIALHLPVAAVVVVLGAGFFFAEQFLLNVEFRRQAHTFTLAGIPLVIGVLVVSPLVFVLTRLVASVLAFVWQRVSVDKMAYNSAAYAFEAAADALLRRSSNQSGKYHPERSLGIATSMVPARVSQSRAR